MTFQDKIGCRVQTHKYNFATSYTEFCNSCPEVCTNTPGKLYNILQRNSPEKNILHNGIAKKKEHSTMEQPRKEHT